jgi:hypothetical protein
MDAATKQYVDNKIITVNETFANYLPLAGGILTGSLTLTSGSLTLAADPTAALHAATKEYVDSKTATLVGVPDAPSDGTTFGRNNGAWSNRIDVGTY